MLGLGASQIPETARLFSGSELCRARSVLALTAAPSSLPCREAERDTIACFVREAVKAGEKPSLPQCVLGNRSHLFPVCSEERSVCGGFGLE